MGENVGTALGEEVGTWLGRVLGAAEGVKEGENVGDRVDVVGANVVSPGVGIGDGMTLGAAVVGYGLGPLEGV